MFFVARLLVKSVVVAVILAIGYAVLTLGQPITAQNVETAGLRLCRIAKGATILTSRSASTLRLRSECGCLATTFVQKAGPARAATLLEALRAHVTARLGDARGGKSAGMSGGMSGADVAHLIEFVQLAELSCAKA